MKVLVINPNSDTKTTLLLQEAVNKYSKNRITAKVVGLHNTSELIASKEDWAIALPEMIEIVREDKYDAYIVACHSDPNLDVLREISEKPIVGIAEASMRIASSLGNGFAVISPSIKSASNKIALARKYHCNDLFVELVATNSSSYDDVKKACVQAIENVRVDSVILGCANYSGYDVRLEKELGFPVIDGVVYAVAFAESLVNVNNYKKSQFEMDSSDN